MAGGIKSFIKRFNFDDDDYYDDDEFYDDDYDEDEDEEDTSRSGLFRNKSKDTYEDDYDEDYEDDYEDRKSRRKSTKSAKSSKSSKITSINRKSSSYEGMDVRIIKPSNFDLDTHEIADTLLEQRTVILNLEGIEVSLAQRIIDFSFGACYTLHGNFRAITKSILLITPSNVNITGVLDKVNESLSISDD